MKKPEVIEIFADNGEHSHWELLHLETGHVLWSEERMSEELSAELDSEAEYINSRINPVQTLSERLSEMVDSREEFWAQYFI